MTLKTAIAAVLKATRKARGLSQNNLAQVSSRTYISKLERGQSSPTLEMMSTLSSPLGMSPLALVTLTLAAEAGQSIMSLIKTAESELVALKEAGIFNELQIELAEPEPWARPIMATKSRPPAKASQQTEFRFTD
ncbi:helix-turn-helix domain-containing protein [Pseudomonas putida]|uniref:helix-turn-helix domain-containing protein n=1 Tax=Pseudomonas putida TaxID=303 RepID=UPI0023649336|nr:helix-turn-helix domain-containing protein [Pseudomonas putida]MDD1963791.1 helix-turn-helix domain-containing protein [Pseudomonas putida]